MAQRAPHMLIICGPTGVGKSDFAERIAQVIPAEIINMDVGQFYKFHAHAQELCPVLQQVPRE